MANPIDWQRCGIRRHLRAPRQCRTRYQTRLSRRRTVRYEELETRQLLAGDVGASLGAFTDQPDDTHVGDHPASWHDWREPGAVHGLKWLDANGNAERDPDEPGVPGVTIYSDQNRNGRLDPEEPHTVTLASGADTSGDEAGRYWLEGLRPGMHVIREVVPDGFVQTYPMRRAWDAAPRPRHDGMSWQNRGAHIVFVRPGATVEGIDFGNQPETAAAGSVHGIKWLDANGNGQRDPGEEGLPDVTIYSDSNRNGRLDPDEPETVTSKDDPVTDFNEAGQYQLDGLEPGRHVIREIVPDGYRQTFPRRHAFFSLFARPKYMPARFNGAHVVHVEPGGVVEGIDFGNQPRTIETGGVHGVKWLDANGNGERDAGEDGMAGVTIYSDLNHNGQLDRGEPNTVTMEDNPDTDFDEAGQFDLGGLRRGLHVIREVVPDGYVQTYPARLHVAWPLSTEAGRHGLAWHHGGGHVVFIRPGSAVEGINFGNQPVVVETGSIRGVKWLDANGNGRRDSDELGMSGVTIYADLNRNDRLDPDEPQTVTLEDDPTTRVDESGQYRLDDLAPGRYMIREVVPDGFIQTYPASRIVPPWPWHGDTPHVLRVGPGETVEGIDFGNQPRPEDGDSDSSPADHDATLSRDTHHHGWTDAPHAPRRGLTDRELAFVWSPTRNWRR